MKFIARAQANPLRGGSFRIGTTLRLALKKEVRRRCGNASAYFISSFIQTTFLIVIRIIYFLQKQIRNKQTVKQGRNNEQHRKHARLMEKSPKQKGVYARSFVTNERHWTHSNISHQICTCFSFLLLRTGCTPESRDICFLRSTAWRIPIPDSEKNSRSSSRAYSIYRIHRNVSVCL